MNHCDIGSVRPADDFESIAEYWDHVQKEIESYRGDFFAKNTFSHTRALKYRAFEDSLRESCFQAFKTGYSVIFESIYKGTNIIMPQIAVPEKITVPDKVFYTEKELRDEITIITS